MFKEARKGLFIFTYTFYFLNTTKLRYKDLKGSFRHYVQKAISE